MQFLIVTGLRGCEGAVLVHFQQDPVIRLKSDHQEIKTEDETWGTEVRARATVPARGGM